MTMEVFHGKHILITGAGGYLAARLAERFKNVPCHLTRLTRSRARLSAMSDGAARCEDIIGDVRDMNIWKRALLNKDYVFHFAAQTSTAVADDNPHADLEANVAPMINMLETCRRQRWTPAVLFASTAAIYGAPVSLPVNESHADRPMSALDLHKQMAEQYLAWYARRGLVRGVSLRLSNVFGPGPASGRPDREILNHIVKRAMIGERLVVAQPGHQLRDFIYIDDAINAFIAAAVHIEEISGRHFLVCSGESKTILETFQMVAERVARVTHCAVETVLGAPAAKAPARESRHFVGDAGAFRAATGWQPATDMLTGIDLTIASLAT